MMRLQLSGWALGVVCIVLVALIWSASSVLVQAIFVDAGFRKPVFLTWVANSLFALILPAECVARRLAWRRGLRRFSYDVDERRSARAGIMIAPVWFAANCSYNIGMSLTSLTSSTIISTSSAAFTLLLSVVWIRERPTPFKLLGVGLCWLGNGFTAVGDDSGAGLNASTPEACDNSTAMALGSNGTCGQHPVATSILGDLVCLAGAVLYALYTVGIRRLAPPNLSVFFGCLGATTCVVFGPLVLMLHLTGVETADGLTGAIFGLLIAKGLFDNVLSELLWAKAVMLTTPSVATVGLSLTIPLAILSDLMLPHEWLVDPSPPTVWSALAALTVILGFVAINLAAADKADETDTLAGSSDGSSCGCFEASAERFTHCMHSPSCMRCIQCTYRSVHCVWRRQWPTRCFPHISAGADGVVSTATASRHSTRPPPRQCWTQPINQGAHPTPMLAECSRPSLLDALALRTQTQWKLRSGDRTSAAPQQRSVSRTLTCRATR